MIRGAQLNYSCFLIVVVIVLTACRKEASGPKSFDSPVAAADAVSTFAVEPGFKIELIAAEPLIADPVAMEIDENGAMYVVENHGYPLDKKRSSKVKLLRDRDGDGVMDHSTVFADTLMMPTGVMRWKKGILVTDAPDILYMEDTNNDDKADIIRTMLTGFALSNPQHNVNTPIYGLDNWIYIAHERTVGSEVYRDAFGDTGGEIFFPDKPDGVRLPVNANGRNVRMRPDTYELEMLASTTQYGHTFDEWGNYFLVNNSNHLMHSVVPAEYITRNPGLIVQRSTSSLPDHGNAAEVFPITNTPDRQLLTDVGVMTSACAITAYTGGGFGEEFNSNTTFVAEPVSNIVHADKLRHRGSTFVASRMHGEKEFLASTDMWSRPVNLYVGPDGALYVVDYYREIIEHPEWLSEDVINSGKLYNGHDMGRIFRISAVEAKPASWTKNLALGSASDEELVEKLSDPNLWWRRNAQRLLIDRNAKAIVPALVKIVQDHETAWGRLHALWTLHGLGQLKGELIEKALRDREPGVRMNAIKLAELHMEYPTIAAHLIAMQDDNDAKVRYQLLCTLGFVDTSEAASVRNKILFRDIEDEFVQVAALSARASQTESLLDSVLVQYGRHVPAYGTLVQSLTAMITARGTSPYGYRLLQQATSPVPEDSVTWQVAVLKGMARGLDSRNTPLQSHEQRILLSTFFDHPAYAVRQASLQVLQSGRLSDDAQARAAMERARKIGVDQNKHERERSLAIDFLALQRNPAPDAPLLKRLILEEKSLPVQLAAIRTLNAIPDDGIAAFFMQYWPDLAPAVQDAALNTFMEKESRVRLLVDALEAGKVQPTSIGWQRSIRLMTQRNVALRNRARTFFEKGGERKKVIDEYKPALEVEGDVAKGELVYQQTCAICHQIKGEKGISFGPDLGTIQSWPASGILTNIIDPNQSIAHGFDLWNIVLRNGESLQGVITDETPSSVTVRSASGVVNTVGRDDIASQKALNMSAMPVGLENNITHQQMADLLAFLRDGNR